MLLINLVYMLSADIKFLRCVLSIFKIENDLSPFEMLQVTLKYNCRPLLQSLITSIAVIVFCSIGFDS